MKIGVVCLGEGGLVPMVQAEVLNRAGSSSSFDALLDTGFSGAVCAPKTMVRNLGLAWNGTHLVVLADASEIEVDVYIGFVGFAGRQYRCAVLATGDIPTVGMHLLQGMKVCFEAAEGGTIEIEN